MAQTVTEIIDDIDDELDDDFYDSEGNCCSSGLYDAGGHAIPERWADYADDVWEREKDRRMFEE